MILIEAKGRAKLYKIADDHYVVNYVRKVNFDGIIENCECVEVFEGNESRSGGGYSDGLYHTKYKNPDTYENAYAFYKSKV